MEKIVEELKEKHAASYNIKKLSAWAHLLHMGKHDSYETPPNLPYFGKGGEGMKDKRKSQKTPVEISSSPSKCLELR